MALFSDQQELKILAHHSPRRENLLTTLFFLSYVDILDAEIEAAHVFLKSVYNIFLQGSRLDLCRSGSSCFFGSGSLMRVRCRLAARACFVTRQLGAVCATAVASEIWRGYERGQRQLCWRQ